jgi:hypothetical protein
MPRTKDSHPFRRRSSMKGVQAKAQRAQKNVSEALVSSTWFAREFLPRYLAENPTAMMRVVAVVRSDPKAEQAILARLEKDASGGSYV